VEPYWPGLFAKALEGISVKDLITNVGSGVGAGPAPGGGNFKWKWTAKPQIGILLYIKQLYQIVCEYLDVRRMKEVGNGYITSHVNYVSRSIVTWVKLKRLCDEGYVAVSWFPPLAFFR
jgi:hypothetical protein